MELTGITNAVGLYGYNKSEPCNETFKTFYYKALDILSSINLEPTYIGVDGTGYSEELLKYKGGRSKSKLVSSDFSNITGLTLCVNPAGSDSPAFDTFAELHLGYFSHLNEVILYFTIDNAFINFFDSTFEEVISSLLGIYEFDFGFALQDKKINTPSIHIIGADNGRLNKDEELALRKWYSSSPEDRLERIRDVYPYNILSKNQLSFKQKNGFNLKEYITEKSGMELVAIKDDDLYLWKIKDLTLMKNITNDLKGYEALISY